MNTRSLSHDENYLSVLKKKTVIAISSLIAREFIIKLIAIVGQLFLVHLFSPKDFGIIAIISVIVSLIDQVSDIGLTQATIQQKDTPSQKILSSIFFTKQILMTIIVATLV